jgi:hypothetical protein
MIWDLNVIIKYMILLEVALVMMISNRSSYNLSFFLVFYEWKNWRNWFARSISVVGLKLEILGLESSRAILRHQTTFFWIKIL